MSFKLRLLLLTVILGVVAMVVARKQPFQATSRNPDRQNAAKLVVRYATDEFVAACFVRPKGLCEHPFFGSLPIDAVLPDPLSLSRLDEMGIEEFAVFCGPVSEQAVVPEEGVGVNWAVAARLPDSLDLEKIRAQWRLSLVPKDQAAAPKPEPVTIGGFTCYRVPTGTFLPRERTYGRLRFLGRNGLPAEHGINVGKVYPCREYVEGATKSAAVFTFDHLSDADLVDGRLWLELCPDLFHTRFLNEEFCTAQIELRNPVTRLQSEPISFEPKSFVNHEFKVSRELTAVDASGARRADLLQDFVAQGRLEVVVTLNEPGIYLGVGQYDLSVRRAAFEYVYLADREIVVAQSASTLQAMLTVTTPTTLARRLSEANADIALTASVGNASQRTAFRHMARAIGADPLLVLAGDKVTDLQATTNVTAPATVRVAAEFNDRQSGSRALDQFQQRIQSTKAEAQEWIKDSFHVRDSIGSLLSMGMDGVPMQFPDPDSPASSARLSEMTAIVSECLDHFQAQQSGKVVTVRWKEPARLARLSNAGRFAVANMEETLAQELFARERFELSDEMYKRVTDRFPHVPQAWFRRAHQLTYNTPIEFDGYESRYVWVRRGIEVLLDGAEENPDTNDLTWMAARFIGWKIGNADERKFYRELFSRDARLHERLARIVDLEAVRSSDGKVDNWLVAKLLFEHCAARQAKAATPSAIPPLVFFSRPAAAQAEYAQALSEAGRWSEAFRAWENAERLYEEFGDQNIPIGATETIRLNDLESRVGQLGTTDPTVKLLRVGRHRIRYDYWLARCNLEQTRQFQLARKRWHEAAERARQSAPSEAHDLYRQSLQALSEARELYPAQMALAAGEFQRLAREYRNIAEQVSAVGDPPAILALIEESQPISRLPLMDLENDSGQSSRPRRGD